MTQVDVSFDVSKDWVLIVPFGVPGAKKGAEELSFYIAALRRQGGLSMNPPELRDAAGAAPPDEAPLILLNSDGEKPERNGFSWRAGSGRIEIYGESGRGLLRGIYDFLGALGVSWPGPGKEKLPPVNLTRSACYALGESHACKPSGGRSGPGGGAALERLVFGRTGSFKNLQRVLAWAARRGIDALVLPFPENCSPAAFAAGRDPRSRKALLDLAETYAFIIETGGWELSRLLPRGLFFFHSHRDLFRMEGGKRRREHHFCSTHPETIERLKREAEKQFRAAGDAEIFHLWPDQGQETLWCSCPTCRAFTPSEQNLIALNAAADVLKTVKPESRLSYYKIKDEGGAVPPRPNLLALERLPGGPGAEIDGFHLYQPQQFAAFRA
jgi:hypothetical protein